MENIILTAEGTNMVGIILVVVLALILLGVVVFIGGVVALIKTKKPKSAPPAENPIEPLPTKAAAPVAKPPVTETTKTEKSIIEIEPSNAEVSSSVKLGKGFGVENKPKKEHFSTSILMYSESEDIWVCSKCDTENTDTETSCKVCHMAR